MRGISEKYKTISIPIVYITCLDNPGKTDMNALLNRISIDPEICGGKPCVKGTRIWVALVLDFLADGMTESELLAEYDMLSRQDVLACIAYGAEMSRERIVPIPLGRVA